jgi:hypothetical protein
VELDRRLARQKERSAYVTHFNDLCEALGVPTPLDANPAGVDEDGTLRRFLALNGERAG